MLNQNLTTFLNLIEVDENYWLVYRNPQDKSMTFARYNPSLLLEYPFTHISLAPTIKTPKKGYGNPSYALWVKILAVLDVDTKNQSQVNELLEFLEKHNLIPSIMVETDKGWHLLWLNEKKVQMYNVIVEQGVELYEPTENLEKWNDFSFILSSLINRALKKKFPFIDKIFNYNYTRLPQASLQLIVNDVYYTIEDLQQRFLHALNINISEDQDTSAVTLTLDQSPHLGVSTIWQIKEGCEVFRYLEERVHLHTHKEWCHWMIPYAWAYTLAKSPEEREEIKRRMHERASLHPDYRYEQNEDLFRRTIEKGLILIKCSTLRTHYGAHLCQNCKLYSNPLSAYSPFFWREEVIKVPVRNQLLRVYIEDGYYYVEEVSTVPNTEIPTYNYHRLCGVFDVDYMLITNPDEPALAVAKTTTLSGTPIEFVFSPVVDGQEKVRFFRRLINLDVIQASLKENHKQIVLSLWNTAVDKAKEKFFSESSTARIMSLPVLSKGQDIYSPFYTDFAPLPKTLLREGVRNKLLPPFVYDVSGDATNYYTKLIELLKNDPYLRYILPASLLQVFHFKQFPNISKLSENSVFILLGSAGVGKTIRLLTTLSLWGANAENPRGRTYGGAQGSLVTRAFLSYILPKMAVPIGFDDIDTAGDIRHGDHIFHYIKALANANTSAISSNAHQDYKSRLLFSTIFLTAELKEVGILAVEKQENTGTARRMVLLSIPSPEDQEKYLSLPFAELMSMYGEFLNLADYHYGHVGRFYKWWEQAVDMNFYQLLKRAFPPHTLHVGQVELIVKWMWMVREFLRFLNEEYNAGFTLPTPQELYKWLQLLFGFEFSFKEEKSMEAMVEEAITKIVSMLKNAPSQKLNSKVAFSLLNITDKTTQAILHLLVGNIEPTSYSSTINQKSPLVALVTAQPQQHVDEALAIKQLVTNCQRFLAVAPKEQVEQLLTKGVVTSLTEREFIVDIFKFYFKVMDRLNPTSLRNLELSLNQLIQHQAKLYGFLSPALDFLRNLLQSGEPQLSSSTLEEAPQENADTDIEEIPF